MAHEDSVIVRRLRAADKDDLLELCRSDGHSRRYYDRHDTWLQRAVTNITGPDRTVFGLFQSRRASDGFSMRLDACVFLKLSDFDNSAELKNLVVRGRYDADGVPGPFTFETLAKLIIEKTIRHCEVREVAKLEIELPQSDPQLIAVFLKERFRMTALRERYRPGLLVCTLERTTGDSYLADPFDLIKLSRWLLRGILPCTIEKISPFPLSESDIATSVARMLFEGHAVHPAFADNSSPAYSSRLRGTLIVLDEDDCDDASVDALLQRGAFSNGGQLRYVVAERSLTRESRALLDSRGVVVFERNLLADIAGPKSSLRIPMKRLEVGGILTVLEQELIVDCAQHSEFVYYLLSGIGSYLPGEEEQLDDDVREPGPLLIVYCPNWDDSGGGLIGIAEIDAIAQAPASKAFVEFPGIPTALTPEDLDYYRTRGDADQIPVLRCARLHVFPQPIRIDNSDLGLAPDVQRYISEELENLANSVYLSRGACEAIRAFARTQPASALPRAWSSSSARHWTGSPLVDLDSHLFDVGLSFPSEARSYVDQVARELENALGPHKVFYDQNYSSQLARPNLDLLLQDIYRERSRLVVVFLSGDYERKPWCAGVEFRAVRDMVKAREQRRIMFVCIDDVVVKGTLSVDGCVDSRQHSPHQIALMIKERVDLLSSSQSS
jgi:hypothetical protein